MGAYMHGAGLVTTACDAAPWLLAAPNLPERYSTLLCGMAIRVSRGTATLAAAEPTLQSRCQPLRGPAWAGRKWASTGRTLPTSSPHVCMVPFTQHGTRGPFRKLTDCRCSK